MAEAPCATSAAPTIPGPRIGTAGLFQRLVRTDYPESTKRALALLAGVTLCICTLALALAVEYQADTRGTVDGQLVVALLGCGAWTAALAGVAYRKPEDPQ